MKKEINLFEYHGIFIDWFHDVFNLFVVHAPAVPKWNNLNCQTDQSESVQSEADSLETWRLPFSEDLNELFGELVEDILELAWSVDLGVINDTINY